MLPRYWAIGTDVPVSLAIINGVTGLPLTGATVTGVLNDPSGMTVAGATAILFPESATPGTYIGTVSHTLDLVTQLQYSLVVTAVAVGGNPTKEYTVTRPALLAGNEDPVSKYLTFAGFVGRWGLKNVTNVSSKDNNTPYADLDSVQDVFNFADFEVDSFFQNSILQSPLDFSPNGGTVPPKCVGWASVIAYEQLQTTRNWTSITRGTAQSGIDKLLKRTYDEMNMYRTGINQLPAIYRTDVTMDPKPITYFDVKRASINILFPDKAYTYLDGMLTWVF